MPDIITYHSPPEATKINQSRRVKASFDAAAIILVRETRQKLESNSGSSPTKPRRVNRNVIMDSETPFRVALIQQSSVLQNQMREHSHHEVWSFSAARVRRRRRVEVCNAALNGKSLIIQYI